VKKLLSLVAVMLAIVAIVALAGCSSSTPAATTPATPSTSSGSGSTSAPAAAASAVSISNFAFDPADVTVKVGGTVTWTNNDSVAHTVTAAGFDSGSIAPGATYSHTFDTAGSIDYHCSVHPQMTGKVTVQ
jgi:plastocyanin